MFNSMVVVRSNSTQSLESLRCVEHSSTVPSLFNTFSLSRQGPVAPCDDVWDVLAVYNKYH